jgi:hypothetical protein
MSLPKRAPQTPHQALDRVRAMISPAPPPRPPKPSLGPRTIRNISGKHRAFVKQFAIQNFIEPDRAAKHVGFARPGIGYKLAARLVDLIEAERAKLRLAEMMSVEEALRLCAEGARNRDDPRQLGFIKTILQAHGVLDPKREMPKDVNGIMREAAGLIESIKAKVEQGGGVARARVRLALEASIEDEREGGKTAK